MSNYRLYGDVQIVLHTCQTIGCMGMFKLCYTHVKLKAVWGCSKCVIYMSNYRLYRDVQNVLYTCQTIGCIVMFKMCYNTCQTNTETINAGMLSVPYFFHTKYQECAFKEDKQLFTENMIEISEQANNIVIHSIFGKCKISSACLVRRCGVQTFKSL